MDDTTKKMLTETFELTKVNHDLLKKIDRRQRYSMYWRTLTIIIAIGSALGVYYFLQPYVDQFVDVYSQVEKTFIQFGTIPDQIRGLKK